MKTNNLSVVLDTNVLLVILPENSPFYNVLQALYRNDYSICISNEILYEYEEQISVRFNLVKTNNYLSELIGLRSTRFVHQYYRFNLISIDPDDNKFVDVAIAASADYIITNDKHFNVLQNIPFPRVDILTLQVFQQILMTS